MKVKELIASLQNFNLEAEVTINDSITSDTRDIWYLAEDDDPNFANTNIDIVLTNIEDNNEWGRYDRI